MPTSRRSDGACCFALQLASVPLCLYFGVALWAVGGLLRHCASDDHVPVIGPAAGSLKPLLRSCPSAFSDTWVPFVPLLHFMALWPSFTSRQPADSPLPLAHLHLLAGDPFAATCGPLTYLSGSSPLAMVAVLSRWDKAPPKR